MGWLSGYKKKSKLAPEHKFEYINLKDFQDKSFVNVTAYIWIYLSILISLACVAADTYTAITLLVYNRWSSQIQPVIPFETAKIVFAICILISYLLIIYDWFFAIKVIRRGGVADAYMNVIALRWNSVWGGKGGDDSGWKRFLVFARLTEQRGKADYVALFTYFSFKGWVGVVFAEGPRVVINTFTLVSVVSADLLPEKETEALSAISKFFENIDHLWSENKIQVVVLCSMAFTTILWVFAVLQLLIACILFITFLWHVMNGDSLRKYCKERIDKRMGEIVLANHKKGIQKENKEKSQAGMLRAPTIPAAAMMEKPSYTPSVISSNVSAGTRMQQPSRQPTLPRIADMESRRGTPEPLQRVQTSTSVASSGRPMGRSQTMMSGSSYEASAPLILSQAGMGYGGQGPRRGSNESTEYGERQQQVQRQWGSPPPMPTSPSTYGYTGNGGGRSEGSRTPAPAYTGSSVGSRTPAPAYAGSSSGRSEGRRTPAQRNGPGFQNQDYHSPSSQSGRGPFVADRLNRQQMQDGYADGSPMFGQGRHQGQGGQYPRRPPPSRSGYAPGQGRFPIAVMTREQQRQLAQNRFPIALPREQPQQQRQQHQPEYYSESPIEMVQSPQEYYPTRQQILTAQQNPLEVLSDPQPYAYEYFPPNHQQQQQQQEQSYQKVQSRPQLPRLDTQTLGPVNVGGYKRPTYTPVSAVANTHSSAARNAPGQNFDELPSSYFRDGEDPIQVRSTTTPPVVREFQKPQRSATARPDIGMQGANESGRFQPPARSATTRPEDFIRRNI
ncbi:hypothetical protein DFP73DRAFT_589695 [Morchella snyderi]|nr:hypothetical protein DFP73DRAFT_589695 [Morchella snyderi]